ncbi:MAG: efflux RND transporter periplasmic adaptor subunit [Gemmatimonadota bacterium]|nr:efflux RND transporter periplasmic adaptor subunit [Gemmatimonadota bacterium]
MRRTSTYVPLALATLTLATGCKRKTAEAADPVQRMVVGTENITIARNGSVTNGPAISGSLDAALDATVRAQIAGSVIATNADVGQVVTKGQTLGRIDASGLQDAYLSAKSAVASAQANYAVAQRNLQRSQTLLQAGAIAQRDLETAQIQGSSGQAALEDAKSRLATALKNFDNTRIAAPFDGIVSQKSVSPGDVVQPGSALFTVVDPSTMRLVAAVPSDQLSMVRLGTDVSFVVTGYSGRDFHGTVTRISPSVDPTTRQVQIIVSIPNKGHTLITGLYADGRISSSTQQGIVVPLSAVDTRMQRPAVAKIVDGKVARMEVTLGMRDPNAETVQVTSGVAAGDTLLVAAAQGITPGTPVRVQAPPSDAGPPTPAAGVAPSPGTAKTNSGR